MNYEQISDFGINKLVAEELGLKLNQYHKDNGIGDLTTIQRYAGARDFVQVNYCNNPSDAWPIIVDNGITICPDVYIGGWYGQKDIDSGMDGDSIHVTKDKNPLRAAMICFLKMKDAEK